MRSKRLIRQVSLLAAAGMLMQYGCSGSSYFYDVAVMTATGLVTTAGATLFNALFGPLFGVSPAAV